MQPLLLMLVLCANDHRPLEIFVSTAGNDAWSGLKETAEANDGPFVTLERARDEIRQLSKNSKLPHGAHVVIAEGKYPQKETFTLTKEDSGQEGARIVYRAAPGAKVLMTGGVELRGFQSVTDPQQSSRLEPAARANIVQLPLADLGVKEFGDPTTHSDRPELFLDGVPLTLARWPNEGFVKIQTLTGNSPIDSHGLKGDAIGQFTIAEDRIARWRQETDLRVHGYWFWDWSDAYAKVKSLDIEKREIQLDGPPHHYGYRPGQRFYLLNALAELDAPGEWHLDRSQGIIYLWPPKPLEQSRLVLSVTKNLVQMNEASHITFRGLAFEACRGTAITVAGGENNEIVGCQLTDIGGAGISMTGTRHAVIGCDLSQLGESGISVNAGDRPTLTPGYSRVENNHIHTYARFVRTYAPAIGVAGVGQRIANNLIHDAPHCAILLSGNDHLLEYNEVHDVCLETGDVGAFYMGRDWSMRGNVVRHNYFHHVQGPGLHGAMSVYLDDAASGSTVYGNVFYKAGRAILIGGGRDNRVENNIFVECTPSVHVDARGLNWMRYHIEEDMPQKLKALPYDTPPWSTRYPELVNLLADEPGAPKGNVVSRNISVGGRWADIEESARPLVRQEDNLIDADPHFLDQNAANFQLRDDSPAYRLGFERIPIERIGLIPDANRASWPPPARTPGS